MPLVYCGLSYLQMSGDPNIVIAKGDATANDYPPGYEVRG